MGLSHLCASMFTTVLMLAVTQSSVEETRFRMKVIKPRCAGHARAC